MPNEYEDVTCLALGPEGDLWAGTSQGVCQYTHGAWQYSWGPRWLPGNRVNALAVDVNNDVWIVG